MVKKMEKLLTRDARHLFYGVVEGKYTTKELEEEYNKLVDYHNDNYDTNIEKIEIKEGDKVQALPMVNKMRKTYVNELSNERQNEIVKIVKNNLTKDGLNVDVNIILTSKIDDLNEHLTQIQIKSLQRGK